MSNLAINTPPSPQLMTDARKGHAIEETISTLAELFPATFVAERWQPHRPLKIGIGYDIVERGILTPAECRRVLGSYCQRRMYQIALAAGGARFDLNGRPSGEVAADQQQAARAAVAHLDALAIEKVQAGKAARAANGSASKPQAKPPAKSESVPKPDEAGPKRPMGLADLKRAAQARRERAGEPEPPRAA